MKKRSKPSVAVLLREMFRALFAVERSLVVDIPRIFTGLNESMLLIEVIGSTPFDRSQPDGEPYPGR
jgi:hypothetical protein